MAPCWGRKQLSSAGSSEPPSIPHIPTGHQEQQLQALDPKKKNSRRSQAWKTLSQAGKRLEKTGIAPGQNKARLIPGSGSER